MKRIWILVLVMILAACVPAATYDPYRMVEVGEAQAQAGRAAIAATEARRAEIVLQATATQAALQARVTATAMQAQAQAQATEHELSYQATATSQQVVLRATQEAAQERARMATETAQANRSGTQTAFPLTETPRAAQMTAVAREEERREQGEMVSHYASMAWRVILPAGLAVLFGLLLWVIWRNRDYVRRWLEAMELRARLIPRGENQSPVAFLRLADGRVMIFDPSHMLAPGAVIDDNGATLAGMAPTLEAQERMTARAQAVELVRALPRSEAEQKRAVQYAGALPGQAPQERTPIALPVSAPWSAFSPAGGRIPLGIGADGPILIDPETSPHLLYAGTTGSGKTRYGLRPLIAAAHAAGWQVAVFDPSNLDFTPFRNCPNVRLVTLGEPAEAIGYLRALYGLIRERQQTLAEAGVSTWGRLPGAGPRVLGVFDEFSDLADSLASSAERAELWRMARSVASQGRKTGVHLAIALQDPTYRSIDLAIRRNMTPVAFRVRDGAASRVVLNTDGAEGLAKRQFLALLGTDLVRGVGFSAHDDERDDAELANWLALHPVPPLAEAEWLDLPEGHLQGDNGQAGEILRMSEQGFSQAEIERAVFGYSGGAAHRAVKEILSATTTGEGATMG